jgi:hypothetical protein
MRIAFVLFLFCVATAMAQETLKINESVERLLARGLHNLMQSDSRRGTMWPA